MCGCSTQRLPVEAANFAASGGTLITSINPRDTDFEDLEAIGNAIGNRRIVLLGEASHGDGRAFLAKSRLIKYLHEQKGFDVLAFEADFIALNQLTLSYRDNDDSLESVAGLTSGVNPIWSAAEECSELLFDYIPQTHRQGNPLHITGIDPQPYALAAAKWESLHELLRPLGDSILHQLTTDIDTLVSCALKPANELAVLDTALAARLHRLNGNIRHLMGTATDKSAFGFRVLLNLADFCQQVLHFSDPGYASFRDSCMEENLKWLLDTKFAGKKMMVWAANSHIGKEPTDFRFLFVPMGKYLADYYGDDKVYSLVVTARMGASGVFSATKEINPHKNGFEQAVPKERDYAFFDFNHSLVRQEQAFFMNALGGSPVLLPWKKHIDGLWYIREMAPSTKK